MRVRVFVAAALAALVAGCGSAEHSQSSSSEPSSSQGQGQALAAPFFGECGSVTDEEVRDAAVVPVFTSITRNSVGCEWEAAGFSGPSVSFSWYRGSPIDRERSGSELIGRPSDDIEVAGQPGFLAATDGYLCEVGVGFGEDFVHWSVTYGNQSPTADPCEVATDLAELTVERAQ